MKTNWPVKKLGEVCEKPQYGFTASTKQEKIGPKILRITDIQNGQVNWKNVPYCKCDQLSKYELKSGDIVFARTGATVGKSFLIKSVPEKSIFASYLIRLRAKENVLPDYLYRFFQSPNYWNQLAGHKAGMAQPNVNASKLSEIEIPMRPIKKQKRIVARLEKILSKIQEAKTIRNESVINSGLVLPSVFHQIFSRTEKNNKKSLVGELTKTVGGGTPSRSNPRFFEGNIPWLTVTDLSDGFLVKEIKDSRQYITDEAIQNSSAKLIPPRSVVLTTRVAVGKVGVTNLRISTNQDCTSFVCSDRLLPKYFAYWLLFKRTAILNSARGIGIMGLRKEDLVNLQIPVPPLSEQEEIVEYLDSLSEKVQALQKLQADQLAELSALQQSILHQAFAGKL